MYAVPYNKQFSGWYLCQPYMSHKILRIYLDTYDRKIIANQKALVRQMSAYIAEILMQ